MGRAPCCDKENVKRGPWSPEEDAKLKSFIEKYGTGGNWIALPHKAGLKRCGKSCRLRWLNYLRPNIKHGEFTDEEDKIICSLYANIGSRWSIIAAQLPGRTDNDVKNYWNTKLKKKLMAMLPSFPKKPSFFPSLPLQSPQPYRSDMFLTNNSSPFYTHPCPNFMNLINSTSTSTINNQDSNSLTSLITNNIHSNENGFCLGFENDHQIMNNSPMLMFGNGEVSTAGSSSEGGSCLSQISYGNCTKNHHIRQQEYQMIKMIKQEDPFSHKGFVDQSQNFIINHNYSTDTSTDQKPKGFNFNMPLNIYEGSLHSEIEEVKQVIGNNTNSISSSKIMLDYDDEYKTTRDDDDKEICYHY